MRTGELRDITPLLTYGYQVRIGEYVSRGWDLLQPKLGIWLYLGAIWNQFSNQFIDILLRL
jgi:hypothetical protein